MRNVHSPRSWKPSQILIIALSFFVAGPLGLLLTILFYVFRNGQPAASTSPTQIAGECSQARPKILSEWRDRFDRDTEEYLLNRDNDDLLEMITRPPDENDIHSSLS